MPSQLIRVLIADNNLELCRTIQEFLDNQGTWRSSGSPTTASKRWSRWPSVKPDVVILDITMPNLDGMAVMERMGELELEPAPKVIVLTALGREDIIQRFTELGAHYFIIKPFDLELLPSGCASFPAANGGLVQRGKGAAAAPSYTEASVTVTQLLHEMGVPPNFKGYNYLRDAVLMALRDPQLLGGSLTKRLYPQIAEKYGSTPGGVEAAIRNAVLACYERGNQDFIHQLCGVGSRKSCPTNSLVIAKLADHIRLQRKVG